jgi:ferrous iron transport protein B
MKRFTNFKEMLDYSEKNSTIFRYVEGKEIRNISYGEFVELINNFPIPKENVVGTFGVLYNYDDEAEELEENGDQIWDRVAADYTPIAAFSFMIFNLLCAPCFAAIGAIKREMNNTKWTWAAIGYMTGWAYVLALIVYNIGGVVTGQTAFGLGTIAGFVALAGLLYLIFRKGYQAAEDEGKEMAVKMTA